MHIIWCVMHETQTLTLRSISTDGHYSMQNMSIQWVWGMYGKFRPSEIDCEGNLSSLSKLLYKNMFDCCIRVSTLLG